MPTVEDLRGVNDPERTKCCDACEAYWEPEFFCDECSGLQEDPYYDPFDPDEWRESTPYVLMSICKNCCTCHLD